MMNSLSTMRFCFAAAAFGLAMLPIAHSASEMPAVTLLEPGDRIQIRGEAAATDPYERSFRLDLSPPDAAPVFAVSNLERTGGGAAIKHSKVAVTPSEQNTGAIRDFLVQIQPVGAPGLYKGTIDVRLSEEPVLSIPLELSVVQRKVTGLLSETPVFEVNVADTCDFFTRWLLGTNGCASEYKLALNTDNETLPRAETVQLALSEPMSAVPSGALSATFAQGTLTFALNRGSLDPGRYAGVVRVVFAAPTEELRVPFAVQVRSASFWACIVITFGILLGQLVRYMNEKGNALASARQKIDVLLERGKRLTEGADKAVEVFGAPVRAAIDDHDVDRANAGVVSMERAVQILEQLQPLRTHRQFGNSEKALAARVVELVHLGDLDAADAELGKLRAQLRKTVMDSNQAAPRAIDGRMVGRRLRFSGEWVRSKITDLVRFGGNWKRSATTFITRFARPLIYLVLVSVLVLTGLETLYVPAQTLGARPITDYLALFAWGLSADVASRTLSNFRGS